MKTLIVDDEPLVRRSLSRAFQSKGHTTIEAENGEEGLELWLKETPQLIILDVLMPGLSGPQVIAEMGVSKTGFVVLMSAYSGEHNVASTAQIGVDLFIPKPFENIFEVVEKIEKLASEKLSRPQGG